MVDTLALLDGALNTTQDGLAIVGRVVQSTSGDVTSLKMTPQALAQTINNTNPMLDSLANLTSKDFPYNSVFKNHPRPRPSFLRPIAASKEGHSGNKYP